MFEEGISVKTDNKDDATPLKWEKLNAQESVSIDCASDTTAAQTLKGETSLLPTGVHMENCNRAGGVDYSQLGDSVIITEGFAHQRQHNVINTDGDREIVRTNEELVNDSTDSTDSEVELQIKPRVIMDNTTETTYNQSEINVPENVSLVDIYKMLAGFQRNMQNVPTAISNVETAVEDLKS